MSAATDTTKRYRRIAEQRMAYAIAYSTGDKATDDRIRANARRVDRLARIMRDPFFLAAERASR